MTKLLRNTVLATLLVVGNPALAGMFPHCHDHGGSACLTATVHGPAHIVVGEDELAWKDGPASLPAGAQIAIIEGDPSKAEPFTFRLRFPAGYQIPSHTHPAIEHVTVLSGSFGIGMGERFDIAAGREHSAGAFVALQPGHPHFAWAREDTVVQLHSVGPWGITYLDRADDPRGQ